MFTLPITDEKIRAMTYKDFPGIQGRVEIAEDKFVQRVRRMPSGFWTLHSLQETHTLQTRFKSAWTIHFYYLYITPAGVVKVSSMTHTSLPGDEDTDYLFMDNFDRFRLEKVGSRFSQQYEECYIDPNQIQLNGFLPAIYFMGTAGDRKIALCAPDTWTEEEKKGKYLLVSGQGTIEAKLEGRVETYLTFSGPEQPGS